MKNLIQKNSKNGGLSSRGVAGRGESSVFKRGFSLVEMLVAIGIFMSIMTIAISSLISIIGANKKAQAIKGTIDSVTFAIESISKDMRIGSNYLCLDSGSFTNVCDLQNGSTAVRYTNGNGQLVTYRFSTDLGQPVLSQQIGLVNPAVDLISRDSNVNISNVKFYIIGADCEDGIGSGCLGKTQPRVIITASGLVQEKGSTDTSFNLQTSVSQRIRR
jgi:type II secretory pathway pseudopilin PulG